MRHGLIAFTLAICFTPGLMWAAPPNVLLIITDDQGYGDLGLHNNPVVRTPNLDAFGRAGVQLRNFYVSPVCSPTRSSLMTGLYNYRTGVVDTYIGRSMMRPGEFPTLPEVLQKAGYRTGLFGKWHLGDNYPMRPEDRGFQQTLWHLGGGLRQPSDPPGGNPYQDPLLVRNGRETPTKGYCTDVFTDAAIDFIRQPESKPFFAYIAYNCPHGPYEVPEAWTKPYRNRDLSPEAFSKTGQPWAGKKLNTDEIAKAYAMIENIDTNFGKLMKTLADLKLSDNTIVIFLTDNGPGGVRFNGGLRNRKGTVYEGGLRVPLLARWPSRWKTQSVETPAAHIDLMPTILEACSVARPAEQDGRSLVPILDGNAAAWPDRNLYFQWHRGDAPEQFRSFAVRGPRNKLVQAAGTGPNAKYKPQYELFDLKDDPFEQRDLAANQPELVEKMKGDYAKWFADVTKKGFAPPEIILGSAAEPRTRLSRQDWRGPEANWTPESRGHFVVRFAEAGAYSIVIRTNTPAKEFVLTVGDKPLSQTSETPVKEMTFRVEAKAGSSRLQADVKRQNQLVGAEYLEIERVAK